MGRKAIICWETKDCRQQGNGEPIDYDCARDWVDVMNRKHPNIRHWVVVLPDEKEVAALPEQTDPT